MCDVADALHATAGAELSGPSHPLFATARAEARALERTRRTILRFLENVPDELCVYELRRAIEDLDDLPAA